MTVQGWLRTVIAAGVLSVAGVAVAQQNVTANDIQRLQDQVYQAGTEVGRLRSTDSTLAARLESDLDDLRDEVVYLKVKMRKEGSVTRGEYSDLRDRVQDLRSQARGNPSSSGTPQWDPSGDRSSTGGSSTPSNRPGSYEEGRSTSTSSSSGRSSIPPGQAIAGRLTKDL